MDHEVSDDDIYCRLIHMTGVAIVTTEQSALRVSAEPLHELEAWPIGNTFDGATDGQSGLTKVYFGLHVKIDEFPDGAIRPDEWNRADAENNMSAVCVQSFHGIGEVSGVLFDRENAGSQISPLQPFQIAVTVVD